MMKEGYFILPGRRNERPSLGDFTIKEVASALKGSSNSPESTLIALLELKKAELQYIAPVTVVLMRQPQTSEQRLVVYRNGIQQHQEAVELQRLFEEQKLELPAEAVSLQEEPPDIPSSFPPAVAQMTQSLARIEYTLQELKIRLAEQEERRDASTDEQKSRDLIEKVRQLQEELQTKYQERAELQQNLRQYYVEFLRTEQHRPILEQALSHAKEEIIIISPWMNRRACNDELCRLIGEAIARGVRIRIGYGIGRERDPTEAARNRNNVQAVKNALRRYIPKSSEHLLEMKETSGTHQKILVCDRIFAINGSFNWLSYLGQIDKEYRNETGTLFRQIDQVDELAKIALQELIS